MPSKKVDLRRMHQLAAEGMSLRRMARELGVARQTCQWHLKYSKAARAAKHGLEAQTSYRPTGINVPLEVELERIGAYANVTREHLLYGDPLPGRSALNRRET